MESRILTVNPYITYGSISRKCRQKFTIANQHVCKQICYWLIQDCIADILSYYLLKLNIRSMRNTKMVVYKKNRWLGEFQLPQQFCFCIANLIVKSLFLKTVLTINIDWHILKNIYAHWKHMRRSDIERVMEHLYVKKAGKTGGSGTSF